jgi:hypothetical protein
MWATQRRVKSPDFVLDATTSKKHVSFDASMVRSVTCGAAININTSAMNSQHTSRHSRNVSPPSISLTSTSSSRREMSPPVASQERLLGYFKDIFHEYLSDNKKLELSIDFVFSFIFNDLI